MKQIIECPYCDGKANLQKEVKELIYRKEAFKIVAHFYRCQKCGEEFTTTEADTISLMQAHNQYREKNNIPFPEEIAATREKYDLPASKMSEVLGLGANGFSNYENGEIPTPAYGNLLSAASEPQTFMNLLDKATAHFSDTAFKKVKDTVADLVHTEASDKNLGALLNVYNRPNNFTGYKKPIPIKIAHLVTWFIGQSKPEFNDKLKLNKLLFFADFTHYKNHGASITGLSYRAIKYGPVPANYDNIYAYLENELFISAQFSKLPNGGAREVFIAEATFDTNLFNEAEITTLNSITKKFANTSTWDIVELSHKEKAWKTLEANKQLIGYQDYAFELAAV
ncbi:MAG: type II TA system antitoxin MqsA family protein [Ferruginibacter sp.]